MWCPSEPRLVTGERERGERERSLYERGKIGNGEKRDE